MPRQLGYGQFYGSRTREHRGDGFTVALMRPDPVREVELHVHETAHLIIHLEGAYLSSAADAPRVAHHPVVVFNPPGTTHRDCYARENGGFRGRFVSIGIDEEQWQRWRAVPSTDAWCRSDAPVMAAAGRLVHALRHRQDEVMEGALVELVAVASPPEPEGRGVPSWLARAVEVLRDRCTESVTIAEVAAACDVHPVSLARAFRRYLHASPGEVLRQARLDRAAALLACTEHSISDIAHRCGYAHQSHLNRCFVGDLGVTPGAWRRRRSH
jgi:AraC family transcriptional regulator